MRMDGYSLPKEVWNLMVNACTQAGDIARAELYVDVMEMSGVGSDVVTYNSVLNGCANLGDSVRVGHWLRRLVNRGLRPNGVTYGTICKVLARHGQVERVERVMGALDAMGYPLNEYFYASLICACGAADPPRIRHIEWALEDLTRRGLRPQSVRSALTRAVGRDRARQLLRRLGGQASQKIARPPPAFCQLTAGTLKCELEEEDARSPAEPAIAQGPYQTCDKMDSPLPYHDKNKHEDSGCKTGDAALRSQYIPGALVFLPAAHGKANGGNGGNGPFGSASDGGSGPFGPARNDGPIPRAAQFEGFLLDPECGPHRAPQVEPFAF
jgi:pentatricopeptide repeat protein